MEITRITDAYAVTGQLNAAKVTQAHSLGFKSIICNRPDGEDISQPLFEAIAAAADATGLSARYVPIAPVGPSKDDVLAFMKAYDELPKPVLAYCHKGGRSKAVFEQAFAG